MEEQTKKLINKCLMEIKNGNDKYVDILYYLIAQSLRYIALKYLRDDDEARDVVQDFWADIYENAKNFVYEDNGYSYLCRIMTCMTINRYNKIHSEWHNTIEFTEASKITTINDTAFAEKLDYKIAVEKAMLKLNPIEQAIIQLTLYEDKTIMQISRLLNIPRSTVGRIKLKAKEKLKKYLSEYKWEKSGR